jgi:hypothetical protein
LAFAEVFAVSSIRKTSDIEAMELKYRDERRAG